jgi:nicotinamide-nucleotide amidase
VTASHDPSELAHELLGLLRDRDQTLALAESHTGGRVTSTLIGVPGASEVVDLGLVTYSYRSKRSLLNVSRETLDAYGSVSTETAEEMATSARDTADTTWGLSTTGVAGPAGGTEDKPVGTTCIGIAYAAPWGSEASYHRADRTVIDGPRGDVIEGATTRALSTLIDAVESDESRHPR